VADGHTQHCPERSPTQAMCLLFGQLPSCKHSGICQTLSAGLLLGAATQEALFQLQLSQAEASARHSTGLVGSKDGAHVGSTPPTPDELASMAAARAAVLEELEAHKQQAAVHR
jgi:hypothetical protein